MSYGYGGYRDGGGYGGYGYPPYVPMHERRAKAARALPKRLGKGRTPAPVKGEGKSIARSFWGQAWCRHLERFGDYESRIPRGRTYVRNGSVVHLDVLPGEALAYVSGSELYTVNVKIKAVSAARWKALCAACVGSIASLVELLRGDLDEGVMERVCGEKAGLFPTSEEIEFDCSCPDYADMCKHVAAVLYGIGVRFDDDPEILFRLRQVSASELVAGAAKGLVVPKKGPAAGKVLAQEDVAAVFGVDLDDTSVPAPASAPAAVPRTRARKATPAGKAAGKVPTTGGGQALAKLARARKNATRRADAGGVRGPRPAAPASATEPRAADVPAPKKGRPRTRK